MKTQLHECKKALSFEMRENISLKTKIKELKRTINWINADKQWLTEEIKKQDKVLEFYANRDNYKEFYDVMRGRKVMMIIEDGGNKARKALEESE